MLCKHEVTGSIPVSSTKIWFANSHSLYLVRRHGKNVAPIQRQAVQPFGAGIGRFHEPQGSASSQKKEEATMFDNKIDWVTRLEWGKSAARRASRKQDSERV